MIPFFGWTGPDASKQNKKQVSDMMSMQSDYVRKENTPFAKDLRAIIDPAQKKCGYKVDQNFHLPYSEPLVRNCYTTQFEQAKETLIDKLFSNTESTFCNIVELQRIPLDLCKRKRRDYWVPFIFSIFLGCLGTACQHTPSDKPHENREDTQTNDDKTHTTTTSQRWEAKLAVDSHQGKKQLGSPQRKKPVVTPDVSTYQLRSGRRSRG
jgi:hypothetical protein